MIFSYLVHIFLTNMQFYTFEMRNNVKIEIALVSFKLKLLNYMENENVFWECFKNDQY